MKILILLLIVLISCDKPVGNASGTEELYKLVDYTSKTTDRYRVDAIRCDTEHKRDSAIYYIGKMNGVFENFDYARERASLHK